MIILSKPYVSDLLESYIIDKNIPVLKFDDVKLNRQNEMHILSKDDFFNILSKEKYPKLYMNAENSISLIRNKATSNIKNKYTFRELTKEFYPQLKFKKIKRSELTKVKEAELEFPLVLKPCLGFFSMGVYKINNFKEWQKALISLEQEILKIKGLYPSEVLGIEDFMIESCIDGDEYAVDAYFNRNGKPVIINILKHPYANSKDTSHRVYYTSKKVINEIYTQAIESLANFGKVFDLKNYAGHIEFRLTKDKKLFPIEFNPLRFAGLCTTDLAYYAYGINPYEYFFDQKEPDWKSILKKQDDRNYWFNVVDIPINIDRSKIKDIDYDRLLKIFSDVKALRKLNYKEYPLFAIIFTAGNYSEIEMMLNEDLTKYLKF